MNPKVRVAVRFVDDNLHRDIYVAEIAQLVRLSRSRFCHLFKSEIGTSFGQFLKMARMKQARQLLETTFEPIKAIAFEVGYNDPTHFERDFKKSYGSTPSQHRTEHLVSIYANKTPRTEKGELASKQDISPVLRACVRVSALVFVLALSRYSARIVPNFPNQRMRVRSIGSLHPEREVLKQMIKVRRDRIDTPVVLLIVCVSAAVLGFALRNGYIATAKGSRPSPQRSDEKVIEREDFPNEPFRFGNLSVKKVKVAPRVKFSARSVAESGGGVVEDWIENLSFTIKNTSRKRMTYINVELDFPETTVNGPLMVYNQLAIGIHPKAFGDNLKHGEPLALEPGETTTFSFSAERLRLIKEFLAFRNFQLADLNRVIIRIDQIIFDDGTKWSQGDEYKPNPAARGGYERVNSTSQ